jgi:hypothetical protein
MKASISLRAAPYLKCLGSRNAAFGLVIRILDLEDALCNAQAANQINQSEQLETITIEVAADSSGKLLDQELYAVPETGWINWVKIASGLDVRAILSDLPEELGLYSFDLVYRQGREVKRGQMKVWIVPATTPTAGV